MDDFEVSITACIPNAKVTFKPERKLYFIELPHYKKLETFKEYDEKVKAACKNLNLATGEKNLFNIASGNRIFFYADNHHPITHTLEKLYKDEKIGAVR